MLERLPGRGCICPLKGTSLTKGRWDKTARALLNPGLSPAIPNLSCNTGHRRLASTSRVFFPLLAIKIARFVATALFPSPGKALATRIERACLSRSATSTLVESIRYACALICPERGLTRFASGEDAARQIVASNGYPMNKATSFGERNRVLNVSY